MFLDPDLRLGELAVRVCGAEAALREYGIRLGTSDQTLREVCRRTQISLDDVLASLRQVAEGTDDAFGFGGLIRHILREHHDVERHELPRLKALAAIAAHRLGGRRPELHQLADLVANLEDELEAHLSREERVLFPYLFELERAARGMGPIPQPRFGSLRHPLRIMAAEHAVEEAMLETIRHLTGGYARPSEPDAVWNELVEGLRALDADLNRHMHLEDAVLYPLAMALEAELGIA